jgi:outer membrane receptor for Fe3+-dicitrate
MTIQATELLQLFAKANQIGATYDIKQKDDGFEIKIYYTWFEDDYYHHSVFITNENESTWQKGDCDYDFDAMMDILDQELEEQKQREIKAEKRKELIARLTPEERELLDLK